MQKSAVLLRRDSVQDLFQEYYFDETFAAALQSGYFANASTQSRNTAAASTTIVVK